METDFILVSCAGVATPGVDELQQESVTAAKRQGEASLRTSGLSYTVVRPGPIIDEPGGYKALVFDQVGLKRTECMALGWFYQSRKLQDSACLHYSYQPKPWMSRSKEMNEARLASFTFQICIPSFSQSLCSLLSATTIGERI